MKKKRIVGLSFFIIGLGLFFFNPAGILAGFAIAENTSFSSVWVIYFSGLTLMTIGLMIAGGNLEDRSEAHNSLNYLKLKDRLNWEQERASNHVLIPTDYNTPRGRILKISEEEELKNLMLKYIPKNFRSDIKEICIAGSLSRAVGGNRSTEKYAKFLPTGSYHKDKIKSDTFHLSDIDIGIVCPSLVEYLRKIDPDFIDTRKYFRGKATKEIETASYIGFKPESKFIINPLCPQWIKDLLLDLSNRNYAGERRNIQFRILEDLPKREHNNRDIIYRT
jgi:hypothetical protein